MNFNYNMERERVRWGEREILCEYIFSIIDCMVYRTNNKTLTYIITVKHIHLATYRKYVYYYPHAYI